MRMKEAKEHRVALRRHGWIIAVVMVMVLAVTACNSARREPVVAVQPTFAYLRVPVSPVQPIADAAVVTRPLSIGNAPGE